MEKVDQNMTFYDSDLQIFLNILGAFALKLFIHGHG